MSLTPQTVSELQKIKGHLSAAQKAVNEIAAKDDHTLNCVAKIRNNIGAADTSINVIARLERLNLIPSKGFSR
jgi:hypothetical protein